jgi:hypothetical protein
MTIRWSIGPAIIGGGTAILAFAVSSRPWIEARLDWCNRPTASVDFVCPGAGPLDRHFQNPDILVVLMGLGAVALGAGGGLLCRALATRMLQQGRRSWQIVFAAFLVGALIGPTLIVIACSVSGPPAMKEYGPIETWSYWPLQLVELMRGHRDITLTSHHPPSDDTTVLISGLIGGLGGIICVLKPRR